MFILNSSVVWVTLCREKTDDVLSEAEVITKMQEITDKGQLRICSQQSALICVLFMSSGFDTVTLNVT